MSPSQEDNLEGFKEIKIDFQEEYEELVGKSKDFPKKPTVRENIGVKTIYYKKTDRYIYTYLSEGSI